MNKISIEYLKELEHEFTLNGSNGADGPPFKLLTGISPVIISCPHSVNQLRGSKVKPREKYVGALSKLIHELTGASLIYKASNDGFDDNYILHTPYKEALGEFISRQKAEVVLDLHGMVSSMNPFFRGYHIELGTDEKRNLLHIPQVRDDALEIFKASGIQEVVADELFKASRPYTVSKYTATRFNTPAMQIEISSDYRNPLFGIDKFTMLVYSLKSLVDHLHKTL